MDKALGLVALGVVGLVMMVAALDIAISTSPKDDVAYLLAPSPESMPAATVLLPPTPHPTSETTPVPMPTPVTVMPTGTATPTPQPPINIYITITLPPAPTPPPLPEVIPTPSPFPEPTPCVPHNQGKGNAYGHCR